MIQRDKYLTSVLFTILLNHICSSQCVVTVYDSISKQSIPFVHVLSADGAIIGLTDQNGQFSIDPDSYNLRDSATSMVFQHISYQKKVVNVNLPSKAMEVFLGPFELDEIQVMGRPLNNGYLILYGFFRSYQIENNVPKYYSDGFMKYYVPINSNKYKLAPIEIIEHRTFQNYALVEKDKLRAFNLRQDSFGPPFLYERSTIRNLEMGYDLLEKRNDLHQVLYKNEPIGQILYDSARNKTLIDVDINLIDRMKVRKAFGYQSIFERSIFSEIYSGNFVSNSKESYDNIERCSQYRKLHFKHKSEKDYRIIEWVHEFYTINKNYISEDEFSQLEFGNYRDVKYSSNFGEDYQERIESLNLPNLPSGIETSLNGVLTRIDELICNTCD